MIDDELVKMLACPICHAHPLTLNAKERKAMEIGEGELTCLSCHGTYPIVESVPVLLPDGLKWDLSLLRHGAKWRRWRQTVQNFVEWRRIQWDGSPKANEAKLYRDQLYQDFFSFCNLVDQAPRKVLDIGCGAGVVRRWLGSHCTYVGLDPLPLPSAIQQFWLVQGVGEYLPFREDQFDWVLVMQTLDHCLSPDDLIAEVKRVLKPGGAVCVQQLINNRKRQLPFKSRLKGRILSLLGRPYRDLWDSKMHFFTAGSLEALFRSRFEKVVCKQVSETQLFLMTE